MSQANVCMCVCVVSTLKWGGENIGEVKRSDVVGGRGMGLLIKMANEAHNILSFWFFDLYVSLYSLAYEDLSLDPKLIILYVHLLKQKIQLLLL